MKHFILPLLLLLTITLSAQDQAQIPPETNDPILPELLNDFYQNSRQHKVAHIPEMRHVTKVIFIKSDLNMLGDISEDGTTIFLNEELKAFSALNRVILFRQLGKLYGMEEGKPDHNYMGTHWELDLQHELYARYLTKQNWYDRNFFRKLAELKPIKIRL